MPKVELTWEFTPLLAAGLFVGACSFSPDVPNGGLICADPSQCPSGYTCEAVPGANPPYNVCCKDEGCGALIPPPSGPDGGPDLAPAPDGPGDATGESGAGIGIDGHPLDAEFIPDAPDELDAPSEAGSACVANQPCRPANPCHFGMTRCSAGRFLRCEDTLQAWSSGTPCGDNMVCLDGECVPCAAGTACEPVGQPCKTGKTSCATGRPVCVEDGLALPGTTCGINRVCLAGECVPCASGAACTPANPCHAGTLVCATSTPTCADSGTAHEDGHTCGINRVCLQGTCVDCRAGEGCIVPDRPCRAGITSCATGRPVCQESGNAPNGTPCGTSQVCNAGECVACASGALCTPTNAVCHVGTLVCDTGVPVCTDTGAPAQNGTPCGSNLVCSAGACTPCTAEASCVPANPCHLGQTSCATGTRTCIDSGTHAPDGTSCGTNLGCANGACTCTQGTSCSPTNPCQTGTTSCTTGTSVCIASGTLPNGTSCAPGKSCSNGSCQLNPGCPADGSAALDCPCSSAGTLSCNGAHQALKLRCTGGVWVENGTCVAGEKCDRSDGLCHALVTQCQTTTTFCSDSNTQQTCNADWTGTTPTACVGVCVSNQCQTAVCGDAKVEPSIGEQCDDGNTIASDGCENDCKRSTVAALAAGLKHTCALLGSGDVRCWGDNLLGQLGIGSLDYMATTQPYLIPAVTFGAKATAIASGSDHICVIITGGSVRCWGKNNHGQHGRGDTTVRTSPAPAITFASPAVKIAAGGDTTCAVLQNGAVHCWGGNVAGVLGKATTADICAASATLSACLSAVSMGGSATVVAVGGGFACAVLGTGGVTCWGDNSSGALGRADTVSVPAIGDDEIPSAVAAPSLPVVPSNRTATLLASGSSSLCARLDNGQMECWGYNGSGQLGLGLSSTPPSDAIGDDESPSVSGVTQLFGVSNLFGGGASQCAKLAAGGLRCWGSNSKGQLGYPDVQDKGGTGTTIPSNLPDVTFGAGITATTVAMGFGFTCALLSNGQVKCWGRNQAGQLGNAQVLSGANDYVGGLGKTPDTLTPVQVFPP